ncbi:hypothetical protein GWK48_04055 [Metallosphaera tengchongensis]|uniref:Thermopsin n=1 Tax=Metallosphaera tengchongensis TaxID=1532350 RepID=A0A6N0NU42_9CREN|nr:hypothetical protein [Metallosphaera tengchongensis]QKQ99674.1 hypothetical protein GWK48_04055 [Metallosphaera tengchongensis]
MSQLRFVIALILAFTLVLAFSNTLSGLVFYPTGNEATGYHVPVNMNYYLNVYNVTKVGNSTVNKLVETSVVKYNVESINGTWVRVDVISNYTAVNNVTVVKPGIYNVNYALDPLSLDFPYMYPLFMSNSTSYGIQTNQTSLILSYVNSTNSSGGTIFIYREVSPSSYTFNVLPSGVIQGISTTNSNLRFNMTLISYSNSTQLQAVNFSTNPGFVYENLTYSNYSASYVPSGYIEYVYPAQLPGNVLLMVKYNVQGLEGFPLGGFTYLEGTPVNFIINVGNLSSLPTNFVQEAGQTLVWNSINFNQVGSVIKTINGNQYNVSEYQGKIVRANVTFAKIVLYVSKGMIVEEDYNQTFPSQSSYKLVFLSNTYINPNVHYPIVTSYYNQTLPYKPVNPSESLTIAIVVTLVVVGILVILHRR